MGTRTCLEDLYDLRGFVEICETGLAHSQGAMRLVDVADQLGRLKGKVAWSEPGSRAAAIQAAQDLERLAEDHIGNGFSFLYSLASVKAWSCLESLVDGILVDAMSDPKRRLACSALDKVSGDWIVLLQASEDDLPFLLASKVKEKIKAPLLDHVGRFESVLEAVDLDGSVTDLTRRALRELGAVRNIVVHSRAQVDTRFIAACPWLDKKVGDPFLVNKSDFELYWRASLCYSLEVAHREAAKLGRQDCAIVLDALPNVRDLVDQMTLARDSDKDARSAR